LSALALISNKEVNMKFNPWTAMILLIIAVIAFVMLESL
jgi:hypothetical protein